eukprot:7021317-Prymnesium_polylepis.2
MPTTRIMPSLEPVTTTSSESAAIASTDSGWPSSRSDTSPKSPHEKMPTVPDCARAQRRAWCGAAIIGRCTTRSRVLLLPGSRTPASGRF